MVDSTYSPARKRLAEPPLTLPMALAMTTWLPPELWRLVFASATEYTGEFDVYEWLGREEDKTLAADEPRLRLARVNVTNQKSNGFLLLKDAYFYQQRTFRRNLVLVCREWYRMTIEHLYGSILIYDPTTLLGCIDALRRVEGLPKRVKRLEIDLPDMDGDEQLELETRRSISELIELCPNLLVFHGEIEETEEAPSEAVAYSRFPLRGHLSGHCKLIQHAMGPTMLDGFPAVGFFRSISSFQNLVALQLPPSLGTIAAIYRPSIELPKLEILDIGLQEPLISIEFGNYLARWSLPALGAVHLGTISAQMALRRFWSSHGAKLHTIRIYDAHDVAHDLSRTDVNLGIVEPSNKLFPALRQLVILHSAPRDLVSLFLPSKTLEIYEIPLHKSSRVNAHWAGKLELQLETRHFMYLNGDLQVLTPSLRLVRLSQCPTETNRSERGLFYAHLMKRKFVNWKSAFFGRGVELERIYKDD